MNQFFGTSLRDLSNDFKGFVREVVEELQTQVTETTPNNELETFDYLSDEDKELMNVEEFKDEDDNKKYQSLLAKYLETKSKYREALLTIEKLEIHNNALKDTLNEQMEIREKESEELNLTKLMLDKKNNSKETEDEEISIFEDQNNNKQKDNDYHKDNDKDKDKDNDDENDSNKSPMPEMIIKSVPLNTNENEHQNENDHNNNHNDTHNDNEKSPKISNSNSSDLNDKNSEILKLKQVITKGSNNMKILKERYKKQRNELNSKNETLSRLKSDYIDFKMNAEKQLNEYKKRLNQSMMKHNTTNNSISKELQTILNAKLGLNEDMIKSEEDVNGIQLEMMHLLSNCIETISWLSNMKKYSFMDDAKSCQSDSVVLINNNNNNNNNNDNDSIEADSVQLQVTHNNIIELRNIVCEFIAVIQQWLKNIENILGNNKQKIENGEEFQDID